MANKTKQALAESLKRLLTTKPLNKITITDITEECAISRMTFYYHFRDIYDLIEWICMDEGGRAIGSCKDYDTWEEGFQSVCRSVLKNRSFVEAVYRSIRHDQIEEYLYRVLYEMIFAVVQERTEGGPIPGDEQHAQHLQRSLQQRELPEGTLPSRKERGRDHHISRPYGMGRPAASRQPVPEELRRRGLSRS